MVSTVADDTVRQFWTGEFTKMNYKTSLDGVAPIANKLGAFLAHPVVRRSICEPEQPLRFRTIMDESQMLIVNLAKGRLGADTLNLLGGLIVSVIAYATFSRQQMPPSQAPPLLPLYRRVPRLHHRSLRRHALRAT